MTQDYPDDADGEALRRVAALGSDMSRPMDIHFHVAAPDEVTARTVAEEVVRLGYSAQIWVDDVEGDSLPWTCTCSKTMLAHYGAILAAQAQLHRLAHPLGARMDGWDTLGNVGQ
jgi:hypothetical protein